MRHSLRSDLTHPLHLALCAEQAAWRVICPRKYQIEENQPIASVNSTILLAKGEVATQVGGPKPRTTKARGMNAKKKGAADVAKRACGGWLRPQRPQRWWGATCTRSKATSGGASHRPSRPSAACGFALGSSRVVLAASLVAKRPRMMRRRRREGGASVRF